MALFTGTWALEASENCEKLLEVLGIPEVARKLSASSHNQVTIMQPQPDRMCMTHVTSLGVVEMSFKFDEEFEYRGPDGEKLKSVMTLVAENKLVEAQTRGDVTLEVVREVQGDMMICTCEFKGIKCVRKYKKK